MKSQQSSCSNAQCGCYQRGLAEARRTVEAEFQAERAVIAMLAASLADAADDINLLIHPDDAVHFDDVDSLPIQLDPSVLPGNVRLSSRDRAAARRLS